MVSPSSIRTITLQPVQTLAKIFCVEETLSETEYIVVSRGHVIGVVLPSINGTPIISFNASSEKYIMKTQSDGSLNIDQSSLFTQSGIALQLNATIGKENRYSCMISNYSHFLITLL